MPFKKSEKSSKDRVSGRGLIDSLVKSAAKRRSSFCRFVRNTGWGDSRVFRLFERTSGKRTKIIGYGNSKPDSKSDVSSTRIRLKLKDKNEVCRTSLEDSVPEPVQEGFPVVQSAGNSLDFSWEHADDSVPDLQLTYRDRSDNYLLDRFSGPSCGASSSHSDVEPIDVETLSRCIETEAGTSPDSEVIDLVPDTHMCHNEEENLLRPTCALPDSFAAFSDARSSALSKNFNINNKKVEEFSEEVAHDTAADGFTVSGSKSISRSCKKNGSCGKSDSSATAVPQGKMPIKESFEECLCLDELHHYKESLNFERYVDAHVRSGVGKGAGHSHPENKIMSHSSKHKYHKTCKTLKSIEKVARSSKISILSKEKRKNACIQMENPEELAKRNKRDHVTLEKMLCVSLGIPKSGNYALEEHGMIVGDKNTEKSIPNKEMIIEGVGEQCVPPVRSWVSCDDCHKWRRVPSALIDIIGQTNHHWTCKDNHDKAFADCSIPQEKSNEEINEELQISDASGEEDACRKDPFNVKALDYRQPNVPRQFSFTSIQSNLFLHRNRKKQTTDEIMVCHCMPSRDGRMGCGEECLNKMLNIECVQGTCPCGRHCLNQQFQRRKYAKLKLIKCGKKGYGLQLQQNISQGGFLIEYVGEVLNLPTYEARQREYASNGHKHFYFMTLNGNEVIDASLKGNLGRFINHSCDPNCRTEKWMVDGEVCVGVFAHRDIKKGEELTFDYNYVRVFGAAAKKCLCGSYNCRGYIGVNPLSAEIIVQDDSDDEYLEPILVYEDDKAGNGALRIMSTTMFNDAEVATENNNAAGKYSGVSLVDTTLSDLSSSLESLEFHTSTSKKVEVEGVGIIPEKISRESEDLIGAVASVTQSQSSSEIKMPLQQAEVTTLIRGEVNKSLVEASAKPKCMRSRPVRSVEICPLSMMPGRSEPIGASTECESERAKVTWDLSKPNILKKLSSSSTSVKKVKSTCNDANSKMRLVVSNKSEVMSQKGRKLSEVEEKLNDLLDDQGGLLRSKDASRTYLKLLNFAAAPNIKGNGEACCSLRDLSIILDPFPKTRSRMVLTDIINKNGLQMLHNIIKGHQSNFSSIPIIRKLLKILEYLAKGGILKREHIGGGPPVPGEESFVQSMLALTFHEDKQIHQLARNFRDDWIPWDLRKFLYKKQATRNAKPPLPPNRRPPIPVVEPKTRPTRWDQSSKIKYRASVHDCPPPGFSRRRHTPDSFQVGRPQKRFCSSLPVSYGIPLSMMQQGGTPAEAKKCLAVTPGVPFRPFPPLPRHPSTEPRESRVKAEMIQY